MRPPSRRTGVFLDAFPFAPAWFSGLRSQVAWAPLGQVSLATRGKLLEGILVVALGADVRLQVVPAKTRVRQVNQDWPKAQEFGGIWGPRVRLVYSLGMAICEQSDVLIGYSKKVDGPTVARSLEYMVPSANGAAITAHDRGRDAPRTFRLDRILWVER